MKTLIDEKLNDLQETWGYTSEELADIRIQMLNYAFAAMVDSSIREEVFDLLDLIPIEDEKSKI